MLEDDSIGILELYIKHFLQAMLFHGNTASFGMCCLCPGGTAGGAANDQFPIHGVLGRTASKQVMLARFLVLRLEQIQD